MLTTRLVFAAAALGCTLAALPSTAAAAGYLTQFGCGGHPRSVAVPRGGEPVFVGDNQTVTQYSASGQRLDHWAYDPAVPWAFPVVAPSSDGVWVGSYVQFPRIERFSLGRARLAAWGPAGYAKAGNFAGVSAIVGGEIEGREILVIVDHFGFLKAFDTAGVPLADPLEPPVASGFQLVGEVTGVAISQGILFAIANYRTGQLSASGNVIIGTRLVGLTLTYRDGKLAVQQATKLEVDSAGGTLNAIAPASGGLWLRLGYPDGSTVIQRISFTGDPIGERYTSKDVPGGLSNGIPRNTDGDLHYAGIAADGSGNVYVADPIQGRVVKLGPGGALPATGGGPGTPKLDNCDTSPPLPGRSTGAGSRVAFPSLEGAYADIARVQRVLGYRAVRASVFCPVECSVVARVSLGRRLLGQAIVDGIPANATRRLRLGLSKRSLRLIRSRRRGGRRVELTLSLELINLEVGGSGRIRAKVRVR